LAEVEALWNHKNLIARVDDQGNDGEEEAAAPNRFTVQPASSSKQSLGLLVELECILHYGILLAADRLGRAELADGGPVPSLPPHVFTLLEISRLGLDGRGNDPQAQRVKKRLERLREGA
jgi:hypothetical protein